MKTLRQALHTKSKSEQVALMFSYIKERGQENYEEEISQYQHALQTAYLAKKSDSSEALITAALLHDLGHMLADDIAGGINPTEIDDYHENMGAKFLAEYFPPAVTEPIRLHVAAKRYICTTQTEYFEGLSEASQKSFHLQGGEMSPVELSDFEGNPYYASAIQLRKWDDQAKLVGLEIPEVEVYGSAVLAVLK